MATSEQAVGKKRKHKFVRDKSALGIPGSRGVHKISERNSSGSSASSSTTYTSSSCSSSNSSYLSSASSRRSLAAAGCRPSTGVRISCIIGCNNFYL